jgi:hypothetical protein
MKTPKRIRYFIMAAILAATAVVWWACQFERTIDQAGPSAPLSMPLVQILNELANSQTPQEAEKAITHLLEKTGIGLPVKGSDYNEYYLPDEFVSALAQNHLLYRRGEDSTTWAEAFELERIVSDAKWTAPVEFNGAMVKLEERANAALADPESPNHALLLAMLAQGTKLPQSIAAPAPTDLISPIQEFLFEVWMNSEFGDLNSLEKKKVKGYTHFKFVFVKCDDKGRAKEEKEEVKVPWSQSAAKACMEKVRTRYEKAVKACYKTYDKCRKKKSNPALFCCEQLRDCLLAAHAKALSDINDCLLGHDQGKGK